MASATATLTTPSAAVPVITPLGRVVVHLVLPLLRARPIALTLLRPRRITCEVLYRVQHAHNRRVQHPVALLLRRHLHRLLHEAVAPRRAIEPAPRPLPLPRVEWRHKRGVLLTANVVSIMDSAKGALGG